MIASFPICARRALLAALVASSVACSSPSSPPPVDNKTRALCASTCKSVAVCFKSQEADRPPFKDLAGCEQQCAAEIDGRGYLAKDVANLVMRSLADAEPNGGDIDCKLEAGFIQFGQANFQTRLGDPAYLEKCTDEAAKVCGTDLQSRDSWRGECFRQEYTYNASIRKGFDKCSAIQECRAWSLCRNQASQARPLCEPWFGPDGAKCTLP